MLKHKSKKRRSFPPKYPAPVKQYKFQWPLGGDPMVLVYDRNKTEMHSMEATPSLAKIFGRQNKFYAMAYVDPTSGKLHITKFLPEQNW